MVVNQTTSFARSAEAISGAHGFRGNIAMVDDERLIIDVDAGRRAFIGALGLGLAGAALMGGNADAQAVTDADVMNFALNFEYLGAQFYSFATTGKGIAANLLGGSGTPGQVTGGAKVSFSSSFVKAYATQLAQDELGHVKAVRAALAGAQIAQPAISLAPAFAAAAKAAGIAAPFNVFADDVSFLLGAFVLEDVCVTALHGAAPLLKSPANLDAAAGLLGVESYQAGMIRVKLYETASAGQPVIFTNTQLISNLRTQLSDNANPPDDQPIQVNGAANIVPTDANSLVFARTPREVLNIAYGQQNGGSGQFFPNGVNGTIR